MDSENKSITTNCSEKGSDHANHIKNTKEYQVLLDVEKYFANKLHKQLSESNYNVFSIIDKNDPDRLKFKTILKKLFKQQPTSQSLRNSLGLPLQIERAVASLLGLAICDALGSCTQFTSFDKERTDLIKFDFEDVRNNKQIHSRDNSYNIWTDDCSMALSLADSLLLNNFNHNPKHSRFMFHMWLYHGMNNGGRRYSIGLGGNISISTRQFQSEQVDFCKQGEEFNNGNGSLMRLAPIPVTFFRDEVLAMKAASDQSRTTHNGIEAKQCCRLLTLIIVRLINRKNSDWKSVIEKACNDFQTECKSVKCLALSQAESSELYQQQSKQFRMFKMFNKKLSDRNWNWKDPKFTYSQSRANSMPGYVGSYCMDALSMALHTVWFGESFHKIALKNANMGGDCDTVGAIAGQIAGAIYGIDPGMIHLYSQMEDSLSERFQVFLKGYKLATHQFSA